MAYAEVSSYPALEQLTLLYGDEKEINFTFLIEWHKIRPAYAFEAALCYASGDGAHESQWPVVTLPRVREQPCVFRPAEDEFQRVVFAAPVSVLELFAPDHTVTKSPVAFTFKYRVSEQSPWKWAGGTPGGSVGQLLRGRSVHQPLEIDDVFDFGAGRVTWYCESLIETEDSRVWQIKSAQTMEKRPPELSSIVLGRVRSQVRSSSVIRLEPYWFGVSMSERFFHLSEDAILSNFLNADGQVISVLAFNRNDKVYTVLQSGSAGELVVAARNDGHDEESFSILVAVGRSERATVKALMDEARKYVNARSTLDAISRLSHSLVSSPNDEFCDGLTFCTWNALGQKLTTQAVEAAVQQISNHDIHISSLLIDDNWQTLGPTLTDPNMNDPFFCGMADFPANSSGFPSGLSGLIRNLRRDHPELKYVGVWHALFGYWAGISPGSPLTRRYKTRPVQIRLMGEILAKILIIDPSDIHAFYDDFYSYLKSEGIDFVKTDVQHMLSSLITTEDRREVIPAYQSAWTLTYLKHFSGRAISCMSQVPEVAFHSLLQDHTPRILLRNSDDFYPEVPASHAWHIFVNAHNSVFTKHLNVIPDWDMFQTAHPYSAYHAAARCISGGPVMITDIPGEHDPSLIEQMVCKSSSGQTVVLRPRQAQTVGIWEKYSDGNILKIGATTQSGAVLLGLFNISTNEKHTFLSMADFPDLPQGAFVIRSHRTGQVSPIRPYGSEKFLRAEDLAHIKLETAGWDIITASPILTFSASQSQFQVAVLGLLGKMSGVAGILSQCILDNKERRLLTVRSKAIGSLGIWLSHAEVTVKKAWLMIAPSDDETYHDNDRIEVSEQYLDRTEQEGGEILKVDLTKVFNERKLWASSRSDGKIVELSLELEM